MPNVKLKVRAVLKWVEVPSVVIPLTRFYLSRVEYMPKGVKRFWKSIEGVFEDEWEQNLNTLEELTSNDKSVITPEVFAPRALTVDLLSSFSEAEWRRITKNYSNKYIQIAVTARAKNRDEWHMVVDAIKSAAKKYDYDFGFEEEEIDGIDEDGPYTQIVKVPKNPYDLDGNDILEPLKRAGVYQFCDELKERYDELAITAQPFVMTKDAVEKSINDSENSGDSDIQVSCFKHVNDFVKERVEKAIKEHCKRKASYALLEITLYDHGQLMERNAHSPFLRQLRDWGLITVSSDEEFNKLVNCVRDKARKLPDDGYKIWTQHNKDRLKCEQIGKVLGETMPYIR